MLFTTSLLAGAKTKPVDSQVEPASVDFNTPIL